VTKQPGVNEPCGELQAVCQGGRHSIGSSVGNGYKAAPTTASEWHSIFPILSQSRKMGLHSTWLTGDGG